MKIIAHIVFFFLAWVAQLTLGNLVAVYQVKPDFLLIALVWLAWCEKQFVATVTGFGVGLLQDLFSSGFLGLMALAKSLAGFAAGKFAPSENQNKRSGLLLTLLFGSLIHELVFQTIYYFGAEPGWWKIFLRYILPGTACTFIWGVIIFQILPRRYWLK
jgi:rod shape-determining protein MreD